MKDIKKIYNWWAGSSAPTTQAYDIFFTSITSTSFNVSWLRGNGSYCLVLIKVSSSVDSLPVDGSTYTDNSAFGSGSQIGSGNYVVYKGAGTSVSVTNLTAGTTYYVRVVEFNGESGLERYNTSTAQNNPQSNQSFTAATQSYINQVISANRPIGFRQQVLNAEFIKPLQDNSILTEIDVGWLLNNEGAKELAYTNFKSPGNYTLTESGTVTYTKSIGLYTERYGAKGNGSTGFLNSGWIASTNASKYTQNSCSVIFEINENIQGTDRIFGCASASNAQRIEVIPRTVSNTMSVIVNGNGTVDISGVTDCRGLWHLKRTSSTNIDVYKNGAFVTSVTQSTTGLPNVSMYLLGRNANGTLGQPSSNTLGLLVLGSASIDPAVFYTIWSNYRNGAAQYEFTGVQSYTPVVFDMGQSNSTGRADENRFVLTTNPTTGLPYSGVNANIKMYYKTAYDAADNGSWVSLDTGENNIEPENVAANYEIGGKEAFLGQMLYERLGRTVYYVKGGFGGTGLAIDAGGKDWNSANLKSDSDCLRVSIYHYMYTGLMKLRESIGETTTFRIIGAWHQGEHDSNATDAPNYATNLSNTFGAIRSYKFLNSPHFFFVRLNFAQNSFEDTVNSALQAFCNSDTSKYSFIEDDATYPRKQDLPLAIRTTYPSTVGDDLHNSYEFQLNVSQKIYAKAIELGIV